MSAAIIGFVGVVIGAVITGAANWLIQTSQSNRQTASAVKAAARLTYDDFLHYQSTIVRALSENKQKEVSSKKLVWWSKSEVLPRQTSLDDRKLLLSVLNDEASQDVAAAQGWMDYLLSRSENNEEASPRDLTVMRDTFCRLDLGRQHLSGPISGRRYTSFKDGAVLDSLEPPVTLEDLGIAKDQCVHRRVVNYGRESAGTHSQEARNPAGAHQLSSHDPLLDDDPPQLDWVGRPA